MPPYDEQTQAFIDGEGGQGPSSSGGPSVSCCGGVDQGKILSSAPALTRPAHAPVSWGVQEGGLE